MNNVGVLIPAIVFAHGQLYVAVSRARSFAGIKIYLSETREQGKLRKTDQVFTKQYYIPGTPIVNQVFISFDSRFIFISLLT